MSTLSEIEAAVDALTPADQQQLLLFLAERLRARRQMPEPRRFSAEQLKAWIAEDETDMTRIEAAARNDERA